MNLWKLCKTDEMREKGMKKKDNKSIVCGNKGSKRERERESLCKREGERKKETVVAQP